MFLAKELNPFVEYSAKWHGIDEVAKNALEMVAACLMYNAVHFLEGDLIGGYSAFRSIQWAVLNHTNLQISWDSEKLAAAGVHSIDASATPTSKSGNTIKKKEKVASGTITLSGLLPSTDYQLILKAFHRSAYTFEGKFLHYWRYTFVLGEFPARMQRCHMLEAKNALEMVAACLMYNAVHFLEGDLIGGYSAFRSIQWAVLNHTNLQISWDSEKLAAAGVHSIDASATPTSKSGNTIKKKEKVASGTITLSGLLPSTDYQLILKAFHRSAYTFEGKFKFTTGQGVK
ncbi:hypothetical protein EGR_10629 [Echinococcus granulosus]|uniref:Uncharacterized protein n=1 Tax=Echinococcus granulosus TaxID=6210 RepID=W6UM08_ECHGR|nr:hypothetical protein EGR_10629 [Echinococcus granulosus]EUB54519.1 hypothetical protein EGR_10629 [Echinococcus granulosus]